MERTQLPIGLRWKADKTEFSSIHKKSTVLIFNSVSKQEETAESGAKYNLTNADRHVLRNETGQSLNRFLVCKLVFNRIQKSIV